MAFGDWALIESLILKNAEKVIALGPCRVQFFQQLTRCYIASS
jgi:hypothetical protein